MSNFAKTAGALAVLAAFTLTGGATAATAATAQPQAAGKDVLQQELDRLVKDYHFPGALGTVRTGDGRVRHYTAGVADLKTKAKIPADAHVRIASNTKTFTAVVVLQLVGEGKINLDAPVEKYLPGLIRGNGNDGRKITIRMLLNHTSGLPNYTAHIPEMTELRDKHVTPRELLRIGLAHKPRFAPGKGWEYSNTGYTVLGLLVEKVTGRPLATEITERIIKPLGLKRTYWPAARVKTIRDPHPKGYHFAKAGAKPVDITRLDPSWGGAAGQLIGSPGDLNRFFRAVLDGRLLKPRQLKEMKRVVTPEGFIPGWSYGLGMFRMKLSCGGYAWGHGGDIDGYETRTAVTEDGRAVSFALTALPLPGDEKSTLAPITALDRAICATR